jgi:hypothetical protein
LPPSGPGFDPAIPTSNDGAERLAGSCPALTAEARIDVSGRWYSAAREAGLLARQRARGDRHHGLVPAPAINGH